jgi:hypothetical protein
MADPLKALLCWERNESNSWNPVLADLLRNEGLLVTEAHDLDALRSSTSWISMSASRGSASARRT